MSDTRSVHSYPACMYSCTVRRAPCERSHTMPVTCALLLILTLLLTVPTSGMNRKARSYTCFELGWEKGYSADRSLCVQKHCNGEGGDTATASPHRAISHANLHDASHACSIQGARLCTTTDLAIGGWSCGEGARMWTAPAASAPRLWKISTMSVAASTLGRTTGTALARLHQRSVSCAARGEGVMVLARQDQESAAKAATATTRTAARNTGDIVHLSVECAAAHAILPYACCADSKSAAKARGSGSGSSSRDGDGDQAADFSLPITRTPTPVPTPGPTPQVRNTCCMLCIARCLLLAAYCSD